MPVSRRLALPSLVASLASLAAVFGLVTACTNGTSPVGTGPSGAPGGFCAAQTAWEARCGAPAAASCDAYLVSDCNDYAPLLNPVVLGAASDCLTNATDCNVTPTGCLSGATTSLTPTTAQAQLRTDYCSKCQPEGADDCEQAFYSSSSPVSAMFAQAVLAFDDAIATQLDTCAAASDCSSSFSMCAENSLIGSISAVADGGAPDCIFKAVDTPPATVGTQPGSRSDSGIAMADAGNDAGASRDASSDGSAGDGGDGGSSGDGGPVSTCGDTYEPDNTSDTAAMLAELDDDADPVTLSAAISVAGEDDDWYSYTGNDALNFTTSADPYASVSSMVPVEVCVWAKENDGSSIASGCMSGAGNPTDFPTQGLGYVGCCSTGGTVQMANYGRTGVNDDSRVMMRVSMMASTAMCVDYKLTYSFTR